MGVLVNITLYTHTTTGTSTPDTSGITTDPSNPLSTSDPSELLISTIVLGALLLILAIIFITTLMIFCCYCQRRNRDTQKNEMMINRAHDGGNGVEAMRMEMSPNGAYNGRNVEAVRMEMGSNGAYNGRNVEAVRMSPNSAYNDETGDSPYYSSIRANSTN